MKRLLIPFIALALCPPAQALDMSICNRTAADSENSVDTIGADGQLRDNGLLDAACSETESGNLLNTQFNDVKTGQHAIGLWGDKYENSVEVSESCALL